MSLLEARNLVKSYRLPGQEPIPVLRGVSFAVEPGERVAVVGRSGAGKTTLLNLLGGLDHPDAGDVILGGEPLFSGSGAARRRARLRATRLGFVFQSYHLMPELDIVENVMLPTMSGFSRFPRAAARERALALLGSVGLADRAAHLPAELSGGEQQRVALARALVCDPELILADEPTGNLDRLTGSEVMDLLFKLSRSASLALVMVTHSPEAAATCSRVLRLDAGTLVPAAASAAPVPAAR